MFGITPKYAQVVYIPIKSQYIVIVMIFLIPHEENPACIGFDRQVWQFRVHVLFGK